MATSKIKKGCTIVQVNGTSDSTTIAAGNTVTINISVGNNLPDGYQLAAINTLTLSNDNCVLRGFSIQNSTKRATARVKNIGSQSETCTASAYVICFPTVLYA